jgi:hypothetical protein
LKARDNLIKAYNRYVVGFSRDDDGEISGTGLLSCVVVALALAGLVLVRCANLAAAIIRRLAH